MGVRVATYAKYELSGLVLLSTGTESQNSFAVRSWPEYLIGSIDLRGLCCRFLIFTYWPLTLGQLCSLLQVQHRNVVMKYFVGFSHSAGQLLVPHANPESLRGTVITS